MTYFMTAMAYLNPSSFSPILLCPIAVSVGESGIRKYQFLFCFYFESSATSTQKNIDSGLAHIVVNIKHFADFLLHFLHHV